MSEGSLLSALILNLKMAEQVIRDSCGEVQSTSCSSCVSRNKSVACHHLLRTGTLLVVMTSTAFVHKCSPSTDSEMAGCVYGKYPGQSAFNEGSAGEWETDTIAVLYHN
jgi:hypothetical protein